MLVPHDNGYVRSFQLSGRTLRVTASTLSVALLLMAAFSYGFLMHQSDSLRADRLETENRLLTGELERIERQVGLLSSTVEDLSTKDEKYRVMAGLSVIDEDVRRVGIGGPGLPSLETSPLYRASAKVGETVFSVAYDVSTLIRRADLLDVSLNEALTAMEENTDRLAAMPSLAPANGHLSSLFNPNRKHPILRVTRPHEGIDIAAPVGEPILAPSAGRVVFVGTKAGGYGKTVKIDHGHGVETLYAHASRLLVRRGERVERGQIIAEVGATGLVTGPHLHYEVLMDGQPVDPMNFIIWDAEAG